MMEQPYIDMECLFPKDGMMLQHSHDYTFMAVLLSTWADGDKYLNLFVDDRTEKKFYLKEDTKQTYYHPITGERTGISDDCRHVNKLRYSKLLKRFRRSVYDFRRHLHQSSFHDKTIIIDGIRIFKNGKRSRKEFDAMNKTLKWPLRKTSDPIFDRIKELGLIKIKNVNARIQHEHQRVCPVDGVVTPKVGEIRSPNWTWRALCGREYRYWVCPHCLYKFSGGLVSMS